MSSEVVVATPPLLPALDELVDEARGYLAAAEAVSTRRNYATDWRAFVAWCAPTASLPYRRHPRWWPCT